MRLSITPIANPEYLALRDRSERLASIWCIGHVLFVLFLALALIMPVLFAMVGLIDSEVTGERAWSATLSCVVFALLIATFGFAVRRYAAKKGKV